MKQALTDSSAVYSLENPDEPDHAQTHGAFQRLIDGGVRLYTTNFIFAESYTLLLVRLGRDSALAWGQGVLESRIVEILRVDPGHETRAWELILQFEDKDFSYTDATTFAVAESLEIEIAVSLDRHFHQYGGLEVVP